MADQQPYVTHGHEDIRTTLIEAFEQMPTIISELDRLGFEATLCEVTAGENMQILATLAIEPKDDNDGAVLEFRTVAWFGEQWKEFS